jgi:phosphatidylglycerophosphate synthase
MNQAGKVLDSALDRYVEFFLFIGLIAFYHPILWAQLLTCAALVGSIMVSYTTALGEITQVQLPRGSMQRAERLVYLLLGLILTPLSTPFGPNASMGSQVISFPMIFSLSLIACIANLSAMSRLRWIRRAVTEREERLISLTLAQVRSVRPSPRTPPPRFGT